MGPARSLATKFTFDKGGGRTLTVSVGLAQDLISPGELVSLGFIRGMAQLCTPLREGFCLKSQWDLSGGHSTYRETTIRPSDSCVGSPATLPSEIFCMLLRQGWSIRRLLYILTFKICYKTWVLSRGNCTQPRFHETYYVYCVETERVANGSSGFLNVTEENKTENRNYQLKYFLAAFIQENIADQIIWYLWIACCTQAVRIAPTTCNNEIQLWICIFVLE